MFRMIMMKSTMTRKRRIISMGLTIGSTKQSILSSKQKCAGILRITASALSMDAHLLTLM